ncbi:MAG: hypothetical protein A2206_03545 [Candidatus Magasanikbacteria bacterium RIFOXYA1_FULL_40_8]|uniref:Peptidase M16 n=1 Tax=Candidatus Magasanikbacteria bacterium RIFOXYA1_FULL_40_8 TaxID=1798694 RepID=A0A1F6NVU5_9BACT|nr:MAG: hypothetical protein A2206_03545 [Candidatus Magasanikbacteria bacterium RIFOXYA1_FULL_40_8]
MFEQYQLNNKAKVVLIPQNNTRSVTVLVVYPVGSRYETKQMNGVSHYIEHLMFKGTKKRKSTLILTREIDRLGAEYNAFTGKENTGYYIKTDYEYVDKSLDILSDMLYNSVFDPKEMEREKTVIVEELRMYKDNPIMNIDNIFEGLMYHGPLGCDIGGTEKNVLNFKRDEVLNFKKKYYDPSNAVIVVAGHIDEKIKKLIEKYFGAEKSRVRPSKSFKPYVFGEDAKGKRIKVERKTTDQVQMILGFPGFEYNNKKNPIASVMNSILGGSMSSRLFIQIRERRGLAYSIRSSVEKFRDTGYFQVGVGLEAKNINKAIEVIKQELEKLIGKGVSLQELKDAKTNFRGRMSLAMEDSSFLASFYAQQALFADKMETPDDILKKIEVVTQGEIQKLAEKVYNTDKMRVAVIGDVDSSQIIF